MKKTISRILCFALLIPMVLSSIGCNGSTKEPDYSNNKGKVEFIAYGEPPRGNWDGVSGNVNMYTYDYYKDIADAGFTGVQALYSGYLPTANLYTGRERIEKMSEQAQIDALTQLAWCEQLGLNLSVRDWTFLGMVNTVEESEYDSILEKMFDENNEYIHSPAYAGNNLHDEPTIQQMDKMAKVAKKYKQLVPNGDPFVNLLPIYASADQLDIHGNTSYPEYIKHYLDLFCKDENGFNLGYVSYDSYPLIESIYGTNVISNYLYNFEIVAELAKQYGVDFRFYIQAKAFGGNSRDLIGVQDLRFQFYTAMAFGVDYFIYYTYCNPSATEASLNQGLVLKDGTKTYRYYAAKTAHAEIHAFENVYTAFNWEGVMYHNGDPMMDNQGFLMLDNPMEEHDRIKSFTSDEDTLIGVMKDDQNRDGFMIVNYSDPALDKINTVKIKFNNAKNILMYRYGQKIVVPLGKNGEYEFKLEPGEGRFVIPF